MSNELKHLLIFVIFLVFFIFILFPIFRLFYGFIKNIFYKPPKKVEFVINKFGNFEKVITVEKSERKKIRYITEKYAQGNIINIGGSNKYKVDHCVLISNNKLRNWDKKTYKIELKSYS